MRRFRIALTGTLGVLGNRLARLLDADESCGRVVLLDLAPFDALFPLDRAIAPSAHLDYLQFPCVVDGERAHVELGFAPRHSTRATLVEYGRTPLREAA
jgi:hypothetical protein